MRRSSLSADSTSPAFLRGRCRSTTATASGGSFLRASTSWLMSIWASARKGGAERRGRTEGMIYVADAGRHVIGVFGYKGDPIRQIGSRGIEPGQFNFPTQLHIDDLGQLYVSDTLNYRIQVFGPDDRFLRMFGQQGDRPGNFAHPAGIATDAAGNVYVTDRQSENVQVFNPEGQILMALGQEGSDPGQFWLPAGIFIDGHDRVYVADSFNKRVQIFELLKGMIK